MANEQHAGEKINSGRNSQKKGLELSAFFAFWGKGHGMISQRSQQRPQELDYSPILI
jgi:hypothetical protein